MRVLVTRPRPDADETAAALVAQGHEPVVAPLLEVTIEPGAVLDLSGVQAVLVTSANGARALSSATDRRDMRVFAVGAASAAAARQHGFDQTESADGDVDALAALVIARLAPQGGALVHVAGTVVAGDLAGKLGENGFEMRREVLYRAVPVPVLPTEIAARLAEDTLDAALFYSPRTAAQFADLVTAAGLAAKCERIVALALSQGVADALAALAFADVRISRTPDQDSLFRILAGLNA